MKAKIYYRRPDPTLPHNKWKYTVKTIEVSKNEPNHILQEFIKITRLPQYTYVTHISSAAVMTISGMIAATVLLV